MSKSKAMKSHDGVFHPMYTVYIMGLAADTDMTWTEFLLATYPNPS